MLFIGVIIVTIIAYLLIAWEDNLNNGKKH